MKYGIVSDRAQSSAIESRRPKRRKTPSVPIYYPDWLLLSELSRDVKAALRTYARGALLDVGCGERPYEHCGAPLTRWIGLDADGNSAADIHGFADAIPLAENSVDTILCTQVLEHVPDAEKALRELHRVLRPGGIAILTVPQYWPLHEEPYDFRRYTRIGFEQLIRSHGFEILDYRAQGRGAAVAGQALNNAILCAGDTFPVKDRLWFKASKAPLYLIVNISTVVLRTLLKTQRDVLNHLVVARKPA
jgi:SAM-dependent methyltransferase